MNEAVFNLLMAVVTAAVTALSAFVAAFVKKKGEEAAAQTNSILLGNVIEETYGDLTEYLTTYIEAEVRKQKALPAAAALESASSANATSVAASTAAATAAAVVQNAIAQSSEK